jgi:hypothetical protein
MHVSRLASSRYFSFHRALRQLPIDGNHARLAALVDALTALSIGFVTAKEALRLLQAKIGDENVDDLIRHTYASADFREDMSAFLGKRAPKWTGT